MTIPNANANDSPAAGVLSFRSARFGDLNVPEDAVLIFPRGLIGFPDYHRFVLIQHTDKFSWLQSVDDPGLAFLVVDSVEFGESYCRRIIPSPSDESIIPPGEEWACLVIVTIRSDPLLSTANVRAPLLVNGNTRRGVQIIIDDPVLSTRHLLFDGQSYHP
jgi:flagellar assembly factor FliW